VFCSSFRASLDFVTTSTLLWSVFNRIVGRHSNAMLIANDAASTSVRYLPSSIALDFHLSRSFYAAPTPKPTSFATSINTVAYCGWLGSMRTGNRKCSCILMTRARSGGSRLQGRSKPYSTSYFMCLMTCCASLLPKSRCVFSSLVQPMLEGCTAASS
jgi:hypothetical protein